MKLKVTEQATGKVWFIDPSTLGWSSEEKVTRAIFDKLSYQGGGGCHKRDYHGAIWFYTLVN